MVNTSLVALADEHLDLARAASSGRSSHLVYGGSDHTLRQVVIALADDRMLDEHENPGEATVQVLLGRVRLESQEESWDGSTGDLLVVPEARHTLKALEDSVVLLTVALRP
jgi:quercetin dioxygenase-like cupin family protein